MEQLDGLFVQFLRERRSTGAAAATLRGYESSYKLFTGLIPGIGLENITRETLIIFFDKLRTRERGPRESKKKIGVENTTLITYKNKLGSFFNWLEDHKLIKVNPFKGLKIAKPVEADRVYLINEEINKIFTAIEFNIKWKNKLIKKRNLTIISIALFLGLRKGEILGLKMSDIYLDKKQIVVRGATSKSKKTRTIPINNSALSVLLDYLEERRKKNYLNEHLFVSDNKDVKFTEHGLKHMLVKVENRVGFSFHMHQFRHTFACNLKRFGYDIYEIMQYLGHADIRMTVQYLRHFPVEDTRKKLNDMEFGELM